MPASSNRSARRRATACLASVAGCLAALGACGAEPPRVLLVHPADDALRAARAERIAAAGTARGGVEFVIAAVERDASSVALPDRCVAVVWDAGAVDPPPEASALLVVRIAADTTAGNADHVVDPGDEAAGARAAAVLGDHLPDGGTVLCLAVDPSAPHAVHRLRGLTLGLADHPSLRLGAVETAPADSAEAFRIVDVAMRSDRPPAAVVVVDPVLLADASRPLPRDGAAPVVLTFAGTAAAAMEAAAGVPVEVVVLDLDGLVARVLALLAGEPPPDRPLEPRVLRVERSG